MGKRNSAISVRKLAKIIDVHKSTLSSWMCHYSLSKYYFQTYNDNGYVESMFTLNNNSITALRKYLSKKRIKYLTYFNARIDTIKKYSL